MNKKILIVLGLLFISILKCPSLLSSEKLLGKTTMDLLMKTKWEMDLPISHSSYIIEFDLDKIRSVYTLNSEKESAEDKYYLSNNAESLFNEKQVGKVQSGDFIIWQFKSKDFCSFKIIKLTATELIIKNTKNATIVKYKALPVNAETTTPTRPPLTSF